jgi:hypothetical protein
MERFHFHVDWFEKRGAEVWSTCSSEALDAAEASRRFNEIVAELRRSVGPLTVIRGAHPLFPGCVVRAENRSLIVVLSRCDCGSDDDGAEAH